MSRIFKEKDWDARSTRFKSRTIDSDEVYRLYFEDGLTQKEIAKLLGFKSVVPIQRIFRENEWEARQGGKEKITLDSKEVRRLYFERELSLAEVAKELGCKTPYPIRRIIEENGWILRSPKEIDPAEIHRLYFDEGLTQQKIASKLGFKTTYSIQRIFREQGWKTLSRKIELDSSQVFLLYFDEKLSKKEVSERLDVSLSTLNKLFKTEGWEGRKFTYETPEERKLAQKESNRIQRENISTLRDTLFSTECVICKEQRQLIHRKDGTPHDSQLLWTRKGLMSLELSEWVPLCRICHSAAHALMDIGQLEWDEIERILDKVRRESTT